jgi:transcription antitermination factor NusG
MFPGYLFARFDYTRKHLAVRYANGVSTILHFGAKVPRIDPRLIDALRELYAGAQDEIKVIDPEIMPGSEVTIASGLFAGMSTLVTRVWPAKKRVSVLLNFLGQEVEAQIAHEGLVHPDNFIRNQPVAAV